MAVPTPPSKENEAPIAVAERTRPAHNRARKRQTANLFLVWRVTRMKTVLPVSGNGSVESR